MPVVGFNSIEEHSKEKIIEIYGKQSIYDGISKKILENSDIIPYICDFSGKIFDITWNALYHKINSNHRYCISKNIKNNEIEIKKIIDLYNKGVNISSIKKMYGCHYNFIVKILLENNIKIQKRKKVYSEEQDRFLEKNYPKFGIEFCMSNLNKTKSSIRGRARRLNLKIIKSKSKDNPNWIKTFILRKLLTNAKHRAKKKSLAFNLTIEWIKENISEKCPVFGISFVFSKGNGKNFYSPSLDRIDNSKGYTKDNVVIICNKANLIKNMATIDELCQVADFYKNLRTKNISAISQALFNGITKETTQS